ncbi:hypothetical protein NIES4101_53410 [Calothrix sp. NIES-4101]|nr:hypothetical protein NIES4101_53410 [Calothrix sp. NIES-4101]
MTKTTFTNGTAVTPEFLNAINNPVFDDADFDGHFPRITDADLSSSPGNVKPEWQAFRDTLKVSAGTGLSASYLGGAIILPSGETSTIAPATVSLTNNATNYVYVRSTGVVEVGLFLPSRCIPLAKIVTVAGAISGAVIDLRPRFAITPLANAIKVFGGSGDEGDYNLASGSATLDRGFYYYRNFTVAAGATLTISPFARIFCSGTVSIAGTVNISQFSSGGTSFSTQVIGNIGGLPGSGPGGGSGSSPTGGQAYNYAATPYGSGGGSGFLSITSGSGAIAPGGRGNGGIWIEAAGAVSVSGAINARGENGGVGSVSGVGSSSGGGGGSGGLVLISSLTSITLTGAASIDVRGGNGGNGVGNGDGGGGGGGGQVVLISPTITTTATIQLTGGSKGTTAGTGSVGGGSGGGFGGAGGGQSAGSNGQLITRNILPVGN